MATNNSLNTGVTPLAITQGGTSVNATPTSASASAFAAWDASVNLPANNFIAGYATTATAAGTTTLSITSAEQQFFTGSTTQTVVMPVVSTLVLGFTYEIVNQSSGVVTVQSSGANTIQAMDPGSVLRLTVISTSGTSAASWYANYNSSTGTGTVNAGTANQLGYYATTGNTISGLTSANNGVLVTSATGVPSILVGPGATGKILQSNAAAAPSYSTATYPSVATSTGTILRADGTNWVHSTATFADTYAVSTLLYASGSNAVSGLATANSAVLATSATGVPTWSGTMTNGQVIIGSTGATPTAATLTQGAGITITNGAGTITIANAASGIAWSSISGTTQLAAVNHGYYVSNAGATTVTLPDTAAAGSVVRVAGTGAGGWSIVPGAGQDIQIGAADATVSVASTNQWDCIELLCTIANTTWVMLSSVSSGFTYS